MPPGQTCARSYRSYLRSKNEKKDLLLDHAVPISHGSICPKWPTVDKEIGTWSVRGVKLCAAGAYDGNNYLGTNNSKIEWDRFIAVQESRAPRLQEYFDTLSCWGTEYACHTLAIRFIPFVPTNSTTVSNYTCKRCHGFIGRNTTTHSEIT